MAREGELSPEGMEELFNKGRPPKVVRQQGWGSRFIFLIICVVVAVALFFVLPLLRRGAEITGYSGITLVFSPQGTERFLIDSNGNLFAWGNNNHGQLGDGTNENRLSPVFVMNEVLSIYPRNDHAFALRTDGSLWFWGSGYDDILFDSSSWVWGGGTHEPALVREDVVSFHSTHIICEGGNLWTVGGTLVTTGVVSFHGSHFITDDGSLWTLGGVHVLDLVSSFYHVQDPSWTHGDRFFAIDTNHNLFAWGDNTFGTLGDGTAINREFPAYIMSDVATVYARGNRTFVIRTDNSLYAWGNNRDGQLGIAAGEDYEDYDAEYDDATDIITSYNQYFPKFVMYEVFTLHFSDACSSTYAIRLDNSLWMWGGNEELPIHRMDSVVSIHMAEISRFVICEDGGLWTWMSHITEPERIMDNVEIVRAVSWKDSRVGVTAVQTNGSVWVWGDNSYGLLGTGAADTQIDWTDITDKFQILN